MDRFFGKGFEPHEVCGMFTAGHLIMVVIFSVLAFLIIFFFRKMSVKRVGQCMLAISIFVTVVEIVKTTYRIVDGQPPSDWVPLYYCSLFIFASWLCNLKNRTLKTVGCSFITMGGACAAIIFTLYPSTSLNIYPLWHFESIYSYIYHLLMFTSGIIMVTSGFYKPKKEHAIHYFTFLAIAAIPSIILNLTVDNINCLFMNDAYELPVLSDIDAVAPWLYAIIAFIGQSILMFWGNLGIYIGGRNAIRWFKNRKNK
ncbi:MAG: YwaF family protein [Clostridia bacterium]|nr:YwaF family protein [Clostridia bacterium]